MYSDLLLVLGWIGILIGVLFFMYFLSIVGDAWANIKEYEAMRSRGYTLMRDENGNDFWVG